MSDKKKPDPTESLVDDDDETFDVSAIKVFKWSELTDEQRGDIEKKFPH